MIAFFNWLLNTQLGLTLRATGDNENMIRALGVNTNNSKLIVLVLSNALFGLAEGMLAQYLRVADRAIFGLGMVVIGLAAVILGESFIAPRTTLLALLGCLVGAVIYRILFTGVFGLEIAGVCCCGPRPNPGIGCPAGACVYRARKGRRQPYPTDRDFSERRGGSSRFDLAGYGGPKSF